MSFNFKEVNQLKDINLGAKFPILIIQVTFQVKSGDLIPICLNSFSLLQY